MIGKIDSTTYSSVTANPDTDDHAQPERQARLGFRGRPISGNREHHEVRQPVEDAGRVVEQLKRFLFTDAGDPGRAEHQRHEADEENRIHGRSVSRMKRR